ncbi:MAG: hypothetical protein ACLPID_04885 [Beijerinckiaceae bacterium]
MVRATFAAPFAGSRVAAGERSDGNLVRRRVDEVGEAPAAALDERRDVDQPVATAGEQRPRRGPRQSSARSTSRARTGFNAT